MDDIDGIYNHNGLKYYIIKYLTLFDSLILMKIKIYI
jgi:hypothetical protein